jgi:hypothetical protein
MYNFVRERHGNGRNRLERDKRRSLFTQRVVKIWISMVRIFVILSGRYGWNTIMQQLGVVYFLSLLLSVCTGVLLSTRLYSKVGAFLGPAISKAYS